jgi:hypothetical protein
LTTFETLVGRPEKGAPMAGLPLSSGSNSIFPMGTRVPDLRETEVARCSRGRGGESSTGFRVAG